MLNETTVVVTSNTIGHKTKYCLGCRLHTLIKMLISIFFSMARQRHHEAAWIRRETTLKVTNSPRERKKGVDKGGAETLTDESLNNAN